MEKVKIREESSQEVGNRLIDQKKLWNEESNWRHWRTNTAR